MRSDTNKQVKILGIGVVLLIGAAIFVFGVVLITKSAQSNREHKLQFYKDAINEWDSLKREEFSNLGIKISYNNTMSNEFDEWNDTTNIEILDHDYYGQLPTYNPLMYHLLQTASEIGFIDAYSKFNTSITVSITLVVIDHGKESIVNITDIPIMYKNSSDHIGADSCIRKGNYYNREANQCIEYGYLSGFGVKVSKLNDAWQLNDTNGGFDCTGSEFHQSPYTYNKIFISEGYTIDDRLPIVLKDIKANIRSAHDPYFTVQSLTEDTNDFGLDSTTAFALGVTALFISIILSIQPIYLICRLRTHGPHKFDSLDESELERPRVRSNELELQYNGAQWRNRV